MGYAISWLAMKGTSPETIAQELELAPTGKIAEYGESLFTARNLSSGWFLLVINKCEHDFIKPKSLTSLSSNSEVIACSIEEHVMVCTSELWRSGAQVWRIEHDAQKSIDHISKSGTLPDAYVEIEKDFAEQQERAGGKKADTDYFFEIPLKTAKSIVGFKHDESGSDDDGFEVFQSPLRSAAAIRTVDRGNRPRWQLW